MSHAKQAAARQERSTGILKSRRYWRGQRELKVAPGHSDGGFLGSVTPSYHTHQNCRTTPSQTAALVCSLHTSFRGTTLLLSAQTINEYFRGRCAGGAGRYYLRSAPIASTVSLPETHAGHGQESLEKQFL